MARGNIRPQSTYFRARNASNYSHGPGALVFLVYRVLRAFISPDCWFTWASICASTTLGFAGNETALLRCRLQLPEAADLNLQQLGVADDIAALATDAVGIAGGAHLHEVVERDLAGQLVERAGALVEHLEMRPRVLAHALLHVDHAVGGGIVVRVRRKHRAQAEHACRQQHPSRCRVRFAVHPVHLWGSVLSLARASSPSSSGTPYSRRIATISPRCLSISVSICCFHSRSPWRTPIAIG